MSQIANAIELAGGPSHVARKLCVSVQAASFWRTGKRQFPVEFMARLQTLSGVPRWELRPNDWHLIWPELVGLPGAPAVPDPEAQPAEVRDAA